MSRITTRRITRRKRRTTTAPTRRRSTAKKVAVAIGSTVFIVFALGAVWIGVSVYRFDHAIHHIDVPASLLARGHQSAQLVVVKGPDQSEQIFVLHSANGRTNILEVPNTLLVPLSDRTTAPIDSLSLRRPATMIGGLGRLGLPISRYVGIDLHMVSPDSTLGRLATGGISAANLIANPLGASSLLDQVASHIYLGPGTPTSAILSLMTVSTAHPVTIPTSRAHDGRVILAAAFGSVLRAFL